MMGLKDFFSDEYNKLPGRIQGVDDILTRYSGRSILGVELPMSNGMLAKCIAYRSSHDIDIEFEDGVVVTSKVKRNFLLGNIAYPRNDAVKRVGETREMSNGEMATCIAYRGYYDIDVRFEDGTVREHIRYDHFKAGGVGKTIIDISLVGLVVPMNCGMNAKCIEDRGSQDIDIEFEDGEIVRHVARASFKRGSVFNPNVKKYDYPVNAKTHVVGERRMMNCGFWCEIIEFISSRDISVKFDIDGSIVRHRYSSEFFRGTILHPKLGTMFCRRDSIAQRVLYYYISRYYRHIGYCANPVSLKQDNGHSFEIDIFIPEIKVGIEFDGVIPSHMSYNSMNIRKNEAIEASSEIDTLYVVRDRDPRIVVFNTSKVVNIGLTYTSPKDRLYDVYDAAKIILEDLGNDVSSLEWNPSIIQELYLHGIKACVDSSK